MAALLAVMQACRVPAASGHSQTLLASPANSAIMVGNTSNTSN
jgi:hypothetical protein